jgi:hypothetical protein
VLGSLRFRQLSAGVFVTCGIATDDATYCWGMNGFGQAGTDAVQGLITRPYPVAAPRNP